MEVIEAQIVLKKFPKRAEDPDSYILYVLLKIPLFVKRLICSIYSRVSQNVQTGKLMLATSFSG